MRKPTLVQQSMDNHFNINYTGLFFLRIKAPRLNPQFLVFCKFGCTQSAAYRQINHTTRNPSKLDTEGRLVTVRTDGRTAGVELVRCDSPSPPRSSSLLPRLHFSARKHICAARSQISDLAPLSFDRPPLKHKDIKDTAKAPDAHKRRPVIHT